MFNNNPKIIKSVSGRVYFFFCAWSFVLLCRPQDYIGWLNVIKPGFSLGLITVFLYSIEAKPSVKVYKNAQFILFLCLILIMFLGVPFSFYRSASLKFALYYSVYMMLYFVLLNKIIHNLEQLKQFLLLHCIGIAIYNINILFRGTTIYDRINFGEMFDANDTAFLSLSVLPFFLLFIRKSNNWFLRIFAVCSVIIGAIVIFKTGSRGGFVAFTLVSLYVILKNNKLLHLSIVGKIAIILMATIVLLVSHIGSSRYGTILSIQSDYNVNDETGRLSIWKAGVRMMLLHPITGVGINRFGEGLGRDRQERGLLSAHWQAPHNSVIQIGAELGFIGLIIFFFLNLNVLLITGKIIKRTKNNEEARVAEAIRIGFIGMFASAFFLSQAYSIYFVFFIAMSNVVGNMNKRIDTYNEQLVLS